MATKTMKKALRVWEQKEAAKRNARNWIEKTNGEVYTVLRSVSSSGMSRCISVKIVDKESGEIMDFTSVVAAVLGEKVIEKDGRNAIRVNGVGMDMGFHLIYSLSSVLYPEEERGGYKLTQRWI